MPKPKLKSKSRKLAKYFLCLIFLSGLIFASVRDPLNQSGNDIRRALLENKFVEALLPTYHALRKLPDVFFFPYRLTGSGLPIYNLEIDPGKLVDLNSTLPDRPMSGQLYNEDRKYVKAFFRYGDYEDEVKIRYRGTSSHHWNSYQKSIRIKFPKQHLFQGMEVLDLIIPYDRGYFVEPLNFYRAKKLGVTTLDFYFSRLAINGQDTGVYLTVENWSGDWLEKRPLPTTMSIVAEDDGRNPDSQTANDAKSNGKITVKVNDKEFYLNYYANPPQAGSLESLEGIVENADDETFKKIIGNIVDLKKFYGWNIMNILADSDHYSDFGNFFMMFNPVTGKFEPSPWDPGIAPLQNDFPDKRIKLVRRILSVPEFREERNKMLADYIGNEDNLRDDLAYYDKLYKETRNDFFTDNAKLYNNIQFLKQVGLYRKIIANNFRNAGFILNYDTNHYFDKADHENTKPPARLQWFGSFNRFLETGYSIDEFTARNPQFIKTGNNQVTLFGGVHFFSGDIIIPSGLKVIIVPGNMIYMGPGVSIFSYSPISAQGTQYGPIKFMRADPEKPWGSLAVINAGHARSILDYVTFSGGSGDTINGITTTGQVSFFISDVDITNSTFENASDDDDLNVKYGQVSVKNSLFTKNAYDSVDLDFPADGSVIADNKFLDNGLGKNVGGDGIDISWSHVLIENNDINGCSDKGISVGERSTPLIYKNTIQNCHTGIAVKDLSAADIQDDVIKHVEIGVAAYRKKQAHGGGTANLKNVSIEDAKQSYEKDEFSKIDVK